MRARGVRGPTARPCGRARPVECARPAPPVRPAAGHVSGAAPRLWMLTSVHRGGHPLGGRRGDIQAAA
eukprot:CAMPEP_0176331280 /NCGR_PEP_ID=MMETSP0121_2-20121125/76471_1 /TAXON_ID=160619 /ORGANISM="Kryptoperidinium foliaceum, Strain CCMP 1326" /LENGTH=67 /DNA_ID=CAMNT_0017674125 /DNA_START=180 /DNA_END=379 /DNA_ORIENTATION=+